MRFDAFSLARNINYCERFFCSLKAKFRCNKKRPRFTTEDVSPLHNNHNHGKNYEQTIFNPKSSAKVAFFFETAKFFA